MKKYIFPLVVCAGLLVSTTGCIETIDPQTSVVTADQAATAINAYSNFVSSTTNNLTGQFVYSGAKTDAAALSYGYDFGYPSMMIFHDMSGQDMVPPSMNQGLYYPYAGNQYWSTAGWALCQYPITVFYKWVRSCNTVLNIVKDDPQPNQIVGAGIAAAMRAFYYLELGQMYSPEPYSVNPKCLTVPYVTESTTPQEATENPQLPYDQLMGKVLEDLDRAEKWLADYKRIDVYTPDLSVVYGLKARAYLVMENWAEAQKYARKALDMGYGPMSAAEYTSRNTGFNTPNNAWIFGAHYTQSDPNIYLNDADHSWASMMCLEVTDVSGCGYAANYGYPYAIDRHLYETIPATDCRKKCFIDFSVEDMDKEEAIAFLAENYSDYPETLYKTTPGSDYKNGIAGFSVKFRLAGGKEGHDNQYIGFSVAVPFMRAEEMVLIEAEAAGRLNEGDGIAKLTSFMQTYRDPEYKYGTHNEAYYNDQTSAFVNEIWWCRRVEFWGEGLSQYDIKRLNKGIIRSYEGTNHLDLYQWNLPTSATLGASVHFPCWMSPQMGGTESYNTALIQNNYVGPELKNSEPFAW